MVNPMAVACCDFEIATAWLPARVARAGRRRQFRNKTGADEIPGSGTDRQTTLIIFRSCVIFDKDTL